MLARDVRIFASILPSRVTFLACSQARKPSRLCSNTANFHIALRTTDDHRRLAARLEETERVFSPPGVD